MPKLNRSEWYKVVHVVPGQINIFTYEVARVSKTRIRYFDGKALAVDTRSCSFHSWFKTNKEAKAYAVTYAQEQLRLSQGLVAVWKSCIINQILKGSTK